MERAAVFASTEVAGGLVAARGGDRAFGGKGEWLLMSMEFFSRVKKIF